MKDSIDYLGKGSVEEPLFAGVSYDKKSSAVRIWAAACALLLTGSLLGGYFYLRGRNVQNIDAARQDDQGERQAPPTPRAQVFQDEVLLKGSRAVVGGRVRNVTGDTLEELKVEIELIARDGGGKETRSVQVEPASLRPGEEGRFVLQIVSSEWTGTRVSRLLSEKIQGDIPFKPEIGARRPLERPPTPKVVVVPRPKAKGDDFLNTPDTPIRIP
jgi:hypothetical protein